MLDLYELIGVPENASEVWIQRSCQTARDRIESDASLKEKKRALALANVADAHKTLTDPEARKAYDQALERWREATAAGGAMVMMRKIVIGIVLIGIIGAGGYWYRERQNERIRFEQERVLSEIAEKKRMAEIAEQRRKSEERLQQEAIERQQDEEKRLELAREQRVQDAKGQRFVVDERYEKAQRDKRMDAERQQRLNEELRERFEAEKIRRQAQVDVERQRRFVEQREREEANAAAQRAAEERMRLLQEQAKNR